MPLQPIETNLPPKPSILNHGDVEFEVGALASREGISLGQARFLIAECGNDLDCIDRRIRGWKDLASG